jgi:Flp pilus assembly pilin Flp
MFLLRVDFMIARIRTVAIWRDSRGQDFVEYALLAGLVAVASVLVLPGMSESMSQIYSRLAEKLVEASV